MSAERIDGKAIAAAWRLELQAIATTLRERGIVPGLAVVLVGDDPASRVYVRNKGRAAAKVGVDTFDRKLPSETSQTDLLALVEALNADPKIHGILVQLPLPKHINANDVLDRIDPAKDVDGFHPDNIGRLAQGRPRYVAATPRGCMRLLRESGTTISGAHAVVVGRSNIVGKPIAMLLTSANATVTLCHSRTVDVAAEIARADIVIAAVGRPRFVKGEWLKPGATVIDVGINREDDGSLCGDVDFEGALERARAITPVPGGVGPMTIAALLANTLLAAGAAPS